VKRRDPERQRQQRRSQTALRCKGHGKLGRHLKRKFLSNCSPRRGEQVNGLVTVGHQRVLQRDLADVTEGRGRHLHPLDTIFIEIHPVSLKFGVNGYHLL
jgi:hypothetical protein